MKNQNFLIIYLDLKIVICLIKKTFNIVLLIYVALMAYTNSPSNGKTAGIYLVNSEVSSFTRKPLSQINNLPSQQLPNICNSPVSSDSSKSSYQNKGCVCPSPLIRDPSVRSHPGASPNLTPSPVERPRTLFTPITSTCRYVDTPSRLHRGQYTPKSYINYNPFEGCAEVLGLPTVSPSLFKKVVSPSDKEDGDSDFSWTIDHLALLKPTPIDTSPLQDMDAPIDPEYEKAAQEAIDRFFSNSVVVPSPWTSSSHSRSLHLMSALLSSTSPASSSSPHYQTREILASPALLPPLVSLPKEDVNWPQPHEAHTPPHSKTFSVWCQTELTLPPVLPKEVEDALVPFCTFTQDQAWQHGEDPDETSALNNTTLRRKLFGDDHSILHPSREDSPVPPMDRKEEELATPSPASTGPIPLDEQEAAIPWGVSMIHPCSQVSSLSPASSPHSSTDAARTFTSSSPDSNILSKSPSFSQLPPGGFRTLFTPPSNSDLVVTPRTRPRSFLPSPKVSPILTTISPIHSGAVDQWGEGNRNVRPRLGFCSPVTAAVVSPHTPSRRQTPTACIKNSMNVIREKIEAGLRDSLGYKPPSQLPGTPHVKEYSPRNLTSKSSPQFSSSPIKCRATSDNSDSLECNGNVLDVEDSPPKFSDSPSLSPISWNIEAPRLSPIREQDGKGCHLPFPCVQDSSLIKKEPHWNWNDIEDVIEIGCDDDDQLLVGEGVLGNSSKRLLEVSDSEPQCKAATVLTHYSDPQSADSTYMDTNSAHCFEVSTLEEMTACGQDTGYHTGSSLQTTDTIDQSNVNPSYSKECQTVLPLNLSEQTRFHCFSDFVPSERQDKID